MIAQHAHTKKTSLVQALGGVYFDFEGQIDEDPVLVGILRRDQGGHTDWPLEQIVLDPYFALVDKEVGGECAFVTLDEIMPQLSAMADERKKPLISWSEHDWQVGKRISGGLPFRYRNALPTVKPWKNKLRDHGLIVLPADEPNSLANFERIIGYHRPAEDFDVGDSIAYIRGRQSISSGAQLRWRTILEHNRHDLLAMRDVVLSAHGVPRSALPR
jgi:hypothetical protein